MERLTERGNPMLDGRKIKEHAFDLYWRLKAYEDAEEQGLLLRLPCKVGTEVYVIGEECEGDPYDCNHCCDSCACNVLDVYVEKFDVWMLDDFGVSVFLTKEEAEKKLAEYKGE